MLAKKKNFALEKNIKANHKNFNFTLQLFS